MSVSLTVGGRRKPGSKLERGCLALFALPFAGIGLGMTGWLVWTLIQLAAAQSWVETPARILEARLTGDDTQRAEARYAYRFAGQEYEGTRVSFYGGSDNIGSFQRDVFRELSPYIAPTADNSVEQDPHAPSTPMYRCFVNPRQPGEAVLNRSVRIGMSAFQLMFALAFGGAGFGLLFGGRIAARLARKQEARAQQHPGEPWKWRDDWAGGLLRADRTASKILLLFAVVWNAVSWPILFVLPSELAKGNRPILIALLFPLVGLLLAVLAIRELLRMRRFGGATLQLATIPGVIGGKLAGVVQLPAKVRAEKGFHLRLKCARTVTTGSGKNRSTREHLLWEEEQLLATDALKDPTRTALPVLFAIPYDQPQSDPDSPSPVAWRLEVTAKNPGVDLAVAFTLPVFTTPESSPDFKLDAAPIKPFLAEIDPLDELRAAGVRVEQTARGTVFVFPPARFVGQALFITLFALIWTGAVAGMAFARAKGNGPPWFIVGIFGFFDLLILWGFLDAWFGCGRIEVERGALRWRKGLFGFGARGEVAAGMPIELEVVSGSQSGNSLRYQVRLSGGAAWKGTRISRELPGKRAAETLIAEIERALGRRRAA